MAAQGHAARELRKAANHGTVMMAWGRLWAIILLVFFSAGALVTLAGVPIQHIATAVQHGQPFNIAEAITTATILALVIGMDLAMVIATMMIRAFRARGKTFADWWGYLVLALFVGAIEALTFGVMIVNNEHPTGAVAWLLVVARSLAVPVCAVFLSLVSNLPVTPNDVRAKLQIEAGQGLMAYLEEAVQTGKADPSALFAFFGLVNDTAAMEQSGWEVRVQEALARLSPDAVRSDLERRVVDAEAKAKNAIMRAKEDAIDMTSRALTSLLAGGMLPEWLVEARPELAEISLAKTRQTTRKGGAIASAKTPQSRADAMRFFLNSLEISPAKAPDKKRGIWVKSTDINALIGDAKLPESATKLAARLGNNATDGTAYIARLDDVMSQLIAYHCVPEAIAQAWTMLPQSGGNDDDKGAVIDLQTRRQA